MIQTSLYQFYIDLPNFNTIAVAMRKHLQSLRLTDFWYFFQWIKERICFLSLIIYKGAS